MIAYSVIAYTIDFDASLLFCAFAGYCHIITLMANKARLTWVDGGSAHDTMEIFSRGLMGAWGGRFRRPGRHKYA